MNSHRIDRRSFIVGGAALGTLVACGSSEPAALTPIGLAARFPDGFNAPSTAVANSGPQRFPFVVVASDHLPMIEGLPSSIEIEISHNGEVLTTQTVPVRGVGQFTPYYPLEFTPTEPGSYVARSEFSESNFEFMVVTRDETPLLQVGEPLPAFDTPTTSNNYGVDPICTRAEPCPFHELTLTEALSNGKPTALIISTPGFCQTDVCGPSIEFAIDAASSRTEINVIHAEVYANYAAELSNGKIPRLSPLIDAWQMDFEPSLFVANADGIIVGSRHFAFDRDETNTTFALI